ncbi:hypothetical protein MSAN_02528300 [Mycena sanguinolenta]|uniref:F-box domain-containing protein n=1 Tax=Mycena sanguinolenta TaxID=230812 RepID=A0A8H6TWW8_9AGAR|nr:hypothetical protein MSAN_02528300 [Mycena sanguinolenta]
MTARRFGDSGSLDSLPTNRTTLANLPHSTMVLTRRAARDLKSIIRRLPAEVLLAMCGCASDSTLASLCSTSRTMRALATPVLYRSVSLTDRTQAKRFIETVASRPGLAAHVRRLLLRRVELSGRTAQTLNRILPLMTRLEDLDLRSVAFWLEGGIGGACFGDLRTFRGPRDPAELGVAAGFLGSPRVDHDVGRPGLSGKRERTVSGAPAATHRIQASARSTSAPSTRASAPFCCALARPPTSVAWPELWWTSKPPRVLETVGEHAPKIEHMVFRARKPVELPLATVAERLGALPRLRELGFRRYTYPSEAAGAAHTWGAACKTLVRVVLDGADWRRVGGQWTVAAIQADDEQ